MFRKILIFLSAVVLILFACDTRQEPWKPVFEDTSFRYLDYSIQSALESVEKAERQLKENQTADTAASLESVKQICLALKDYYIPLTMVRHQIYDADRFFYLKETGKAKKMLEASRLIIEDINQFAEGAPIHGAFRDLIFMIDGCILSLDEKTPATSAKLKNLGHKVNLMLIKGGLTISDMKFS
jgi:hypothetical protein